MDHNEKIEELHDALKSHANQVDDPHCAALCETSAEVVAGLGSAFEHYLSKSEPAWQEQETE